MIVNTGSDSEILQMALIGYEQEKLKIDSAMDEIRSRLKGAAAYPTEQTPSRLSPDARKRIAEAQRKRWRALKKQLAKAGNS